MLSFANFVEQMSPINVIIMREQLNVKQRQSISETPAKGGGGLVETCFSSLGRMVGFPSSDRRALHGDSMTLRNRVVGRAITSGSSVATG